MAIIADTGPLYALADADDEYHGTVKAFISRNRETIIVPGPAVIEVCYLILEHLGPASELAFLQSLAAREMLLEQPLMKDLERSIRILKQYADSQFGMVDATMMAMAERLGIPTVMTLDRRHFTIYRPEHVPAFTLVPSLKRRRFPSNHMRSILAYPHAFQVRAFGGSTGFTDWSDPVSHISM